ncbi:unnamed protein product [Camellia sinensis]
MGVSKGNLPTVASEGCYVMERELGSVVTMEDGPNEKCPFKGLVEDAQIIFRGYKCIHFKGFKGLALFFFLFFLLHLVLYDVI